jgi:hypothetical protein
MGETTANVNKINDDGSSDRTYANVDAIDLPSADKTRADLKRTFSYGLRKTHILLTFYRLAAVEKANS